MPLLETADSGKCKCIRPEGGGIKSQPGGAYNQVFDIGAPQTQGGGVKILLT